MFNKAHGVSILLVILKWMPYVFLGKSYQANREFVNDYNKKRAL
jgi:hypothetical protein